MPKRISNKSLVWTFTIEDNDSIELHHHPTPILHPIPPSSSSSNSWANLFDAFFKTLTDYLESEHFIRHPIGQRNQYPIEIHLERDRVLEAPSALSNFFRSS
jgi:hypothetical protein